jgi:cell division septation protein DedD
MCRAIGVRCREWAPRFVAMLCLVTIGAARAGAQATGADSGTGAVDTMFAHAQRLVAAGQGDAGRQLVDSLLAAAPPGSNRYAETLFWRASFATNAAAAERDYQRLAVEFPLSPRSEDALMRLAQMEIARGDRDAALQHLQRLVLEHPTGASRPRASYWMGRVQLELGDVARACQSLASAQASAPPDAVELRNQIEFSSRRCGDVSATAPAGPTATPAPGTPPDSSTPPGGAAAAPPKRPAPVAPGGAAAPPGVRPNAATAAPRSSATPTHSAAPPQAAPTAPVQYTVQVAAFPAKNSATALAATLRDKGYPVRVAGTHAPYRVRVGRFATRAAAEQMAQRLKAAGMEPWVAEAEPQ